MNDRLNLDIVQQDRDGTTLRRWSLLRVWAVTSVAGDRDDEADENVIESVTLTYVATKLGDLMEELVVVGGQVPSLVVEQTALPRGADAHVGTMDLDVGLKLALLDEGRYRKLTERLSACSDGTAGAGCYDVVGRPAPERRQAGTGMDRSQRRGRGGIVVGGGFDADAS